MLSRPLGFDLGLQIDGAAHADVAEMRVQEAPRAGRWFSAARKNRNRY
jgi:hypothetical protein